MWNPVNRFDSNYEQPTTLTSSDLEALLFSRRQELREARRSEM